MSSKFEGLGDFPIGRGRSSPEAPKEVQTDNKNGRTCLARPFALLHLSLMGYTTAATAGRNL